MVISARQQPYIFTWLQCIRTRRFDHADKDAELPIQLHDDEQSHLGSAMILRIVFSQVQSDATLVATNSSLKASLASSCSRESTHALTASTKLTLLTPATGFSLLGASHSPPEANAASHARAKSMSMPAERCSMPQQPPMQVLWCQELISFRQQPQQRHRDPRLALVVYMNLMGFAGSGVLLLRSRAATDSTLAAGSALSAEGWAIGVWASGAATSGEAAAAAAAPLA